MCLVGFGLLIHLTRQHRAAGHDEGLYAVGDNKFYSQHADDLSGTVLTSSLRNTTRLANRKVGTRCA